MHNQIPIPEPPEEKSVFELFGSGLRNLAQTFEQKTAQLKEESEVELQMRRMKYKAEAMIKMSRLEKEIQEKLKAEGLSCQDFTSQPSDSL